MASVSRLSLSWFSKPATIYIKDSRAILRMDIGFYMGVISWPIFTSL